MSVQERQEQLVAWMRAHAPAGTTDLFKRTPLDLYRSYSLLERDLHALRREGRVVKAWHLWVVA